MNALRHGVASALPVVPGLERAEDWENHRAGIFMSLAPVGALEEALAGRVALCCWRLERVVRYETAVTAVGLELIAEQIRPQLPGKPDALALAPEDKSDEGLTLEAALGKALRELDKQREIVQIWEGTRRLLEQLPDLPEGAAVDADDVEGLLTDANGALPGAEDEYFDVEDKDFLTGLGIPADEHDAPFAWYGWTAGLVRQAVAKMAASCQVSPEKVLARAVKDRREMQDEGKAKVKSFEAKVRDLRRRLKTKADRLTRGRMLPQDALLQKVTRYEAHLSRQMLQALHELQRLQAVRAGEPVPAPAALDVTVEGGGTTGDAVGGAIAG
jgi:hypothetical protein